MRDLWLRRMLSVLAGGGLAFLLSEDFELWVLPILALLAVRLWFWRPRDFFGQLERPGLILMGVLFVAGYLYGIAGERALPQPLALQSIEMTGVLEDWSRLPDKGSGSLVTETTQEMSEGISSGASTGNSSGNSGQGQDTGIRAGQHYRLVVYPGKDGRLPGLWERVQPGDAITINARLERPKPSGTKGGFDPQIYYAARGIEGVLVARGEPLALYPGEPPLAWRVRQQVDLALAPFDVEATGVLKGILFGDANGIPTEVMERYRITGVLHVFAASGSNVAFVMVLAWGLLRFFPPLVRVGGSSLAVFFYALLCGGSLPIVRASIMGIAVLLGRFGRGKVATLRWLLLAACGMFLMNPVVLKDVGFQLSFAAAWGIVSVAPRLARQSWLGKVPEVFRGILAGTLAAQITTFPLLVSTFHRVSLVGFAANLFVLFLLGSVLEVGLLGVMFSFAPAVAAPFFQVSLWILKAADWVLGWLAQLSWADFWVLQPGFLFWLVWYGVILAWLLGWDRVGFMIRVWLRRGVWLIRSFRRRYSHEIPKSIQRAQEAGKARTLLRLLTMRGRWAVLLVMLLLWSPWDGGELKVSFLDVGQGDSLLIQTPKGGALLIDAGPKSERFDAGERIVLPYLLEHRIRHLDAFIVTHEHGDHVGGARAILDNIPVDWVGVPDSGERLDNSEWRTGIPERIWLDAEKIKTLGAGDRIDLDSGAWLEVVGPVLILKGTHSDPNNNSLVLMLHYFDEKVFLTADMEEEEMRTLWGGDEETVNFFKEPHHGSRFSLDKGLLDMLEPQAVFISVGRNTFGHPAPEVLKYWTERGIPVYRTDEGGTLTLRMGRQGDIIETGRRLD